jgi:hypothetical protein
MDPKQQVKKWEKFGLAVFWEILGIDPFFYRDPVSVQPYYITNC